MPNRFFNNLIDLINNTRARASDVEANFDQVEDGFDTVQAEIDLKAPAADPTLTGVPRAPTAVAGTNTSQIATTAFVHAERTNAATLTGKTISLASNTLQATSAQLAAALSDETGTGQAVFSNAPALTNPAITGGTISGVAITASTIDGTAVVNVQRLSGNGVTTAFILTGDPASENNTQVFINGVYQQKDTYSLVGTTLTFTEAPPAGTENIEVSWTSVLQIGATSSDLVSYTPAGTGAVATTVQAKLREVVSVKDFGAMGDGASSAILDTAAVQLALNSGAKVVEFEQGKTYQWSGNGPTVPSNTVVRGNGAIIVQPNADTSATISAGTEYVGLRVACGSTNIVIEGFEFRGPYFGITPVNAYRSIGINISGRYDQYFYNNANYPSNPPTAVSGTSSNITIRFCQFNGWGQSAIIADQIDQFYCYRNRMVNCNRDGVRMYGVRYFDVSDNYIRGMEPGFDEEGTAPNNNVYGVTASRIYHSTANDGSLTDYRPSQFGIISRNIVRDCPSWKALDTHGGTDISFVNNHIYNAHIGIGIDKGGFNAADGYAPPRRLIIEGNIIVADPANASGNRAGVALFAHDTTEDNYGEDIVVSNNYIQGFGEDTRDGNIVVSNYRRVSLRGNVIRGGLRCGINFQNTVLDFDVSGGIIANIGKTTGGTCAGINPQAANHRGVVDGVTFIKNDTADVMTAVLSTTPTAGMGVRLGTNISLQGTAIVANSSGNLLDTYSPYSLRTIAWANILNSGTPSVAAGRGGITVALTATGRVAVTLPKALASSSTLAVTVTPRSTSTAVRIASVLQTSTTQFEVITWDGAGVLTNTAFYVEVKGY